MNHPKSKTGMILRIAILIGVLVAVLLGRGQIAQLFGRPAPQEVCTEEAAAAICQKITQKSFQYEHRWLGIRMQQFPNDLMLYQRLLYQVKPDVVIELGTLNGGLTHYFSMLLSSFKPEASIVSVDIDGSKWRQTLQKTPHLAHLRQRVHFVEGDTLLPETIASVAQHVPEGAVVVVLLDTVHTKEHVLKELALYERFVAADGYFVVTDMHHDSHYNLAGPAAAVEQFVGKRGDFAIDLSFNRFVIGTGVHNGFLRRLPGKVRRTAIGQPTSAPARPASTQ